MDSPTLKTTRHAAILLILSSVTFQATARESNNSAAANPAAKSVLDETDRILNGIKSTEYKHKTDIDEAKGSYYCDCSGFVGYVLGRTIAKDDPKGPLGDSKKRPLARDFERTFAAAPTKATAGARWLRVERLADARPGDIIAWRKAQPKPGNTGHVVILVEKPIVEEDGLVRVVMVDSTTKPQVDDTRPKGTSGIGRGAMWFKVDKEGRPVAHIRGSRSAKPVEEPISVGRPLPADLNAASRKAA